MKTKIIILLMVVMACFELNAQTVKGVVSDKETKEPLMYANVLLLNTVNGKQIQGVATNANGQYELRNVSKGDYIIRCSFSGYKTDSIKIVITEGNNNPVVQNFTLTSETENLGVVEIAAKVQQFEQDADKLIMNVDETAAATSTNAFDLLKKVPGVSIDNDENLKLNGQGGVLFQFDGRDMKLPWEALKAMLKG
ncbi:MAG: carboxypeptidase-like regulatory domain-containing protein, partial [Bacteroidales bacterium]|nr:carboxypeptidase-like regulatory domain-containing protein [Bacteroidales bacterium]